jgi:hypothetical protein
MDFTDEQAAILELEAAKTDQVKAKTSKFFDRVIDRSGLTGTARQVMLLSEPISVDISIRVPIQAFTDHKALNAIERKLTEEWGVQVYLITRTK